jgi:hypothetical protein
MTIVIALASIVGTMFIGLVAYEIMVSIRSKKSEKDS